MVKNWLSQNSIGNMDKSSYVRNDFKKKKTADLVTLSKKGGRGQEKGKI